MRTRVMRLSQGRQEWRGFGAAWTRHLAVAIVCLATASSVSADVKDTTERPQLDLVATKITPIQILEGRPLWEGKETVVRVEATFTKFCRPAAATSSGSATSATSSTTTATQLVPVTADAIIPASDPEPLPQPSPIDPIPDEDCLTMTPEAFLRQAGVTMQLQIQYLDANYQAIGPAAMVTSDSHTLVKTTITDGWLGEGEPYKWVVTLDQPLGITWDAYLGIAHESHDAFTFGWSRTDPPDSAFGDRRGTWKVTPLEGAAHVKLTAVIDPNHALALYEPRENFGNNTHSSVFSLNRMDMQNSRCEQVPFNLLYAGIGVRPRLFGPVVRPPTLDKLREELQWTKWDLISKLPVNSARLKYRYLRTRYAFPPFPWIMSSIYGAMLERWVRKSERLFGKKIHFAVGVTPSPFVPCLGPGVACAPRGFRHVVWTRSDYIGASVIHELTHQRGFVSHPILRFNYGTLEVVESDPGVFVPRGWDAVRGTAYPPLGGYSSGADEPFRRKINFRTDQLVPKFRWIDFMTLLTMSPSGETGRDTIDREWINGEHFDSWQNYFLGETSPRECDAVAAASGTYLFVQGYRGPDGTPVITSLAPLEDADLLNWSAGPYRVSVKQGNAQLASVTFGTEPPPPPSGAADDVRLSPEDSSFAFSFGVPGLEQATEIVVTDDRTGQTLFAYAIPRQPPVIQLSPPVLTSDGYTKVNFALRDTGSLPPQVLVSYSADGGLSFEPFATVIYDQERLKGFVTVHPTEVPSAATPMLKFTVDGWHTSEQTISLPSISPQPPEPHILFPAAGSEFSPLDRSITLQATAYRAGTLDEEITQESAFAWSWRYADGRSAWQSVGSGRSLAYTVPDGAIELGLQVTDPASGVSMRNPLTVAVKGSTDTAPDVVLQQFSSAEGTILEANQAGVLPPVVLEARLMSTRASTQATVTLTGTGPGLPPGTILDMHPVTLPANQPVAVQLRYQPPAGTYGLYDVAVAAHTIEPPEPVGQDANNTASLKVTLTPYQVRLAAADPTSAGTLPKLAKNQLVLSFDRPVTFSGTPVRIRQFLANDSYGRNIAGSFTYTLTGTSFIVREATQVLVPAKQPITSRWFLLEPTTALRGTDGTPIQPFQLYVSTLVGDVTGNKVVDADDLAAVQAAMGQKGASLRADVNGDGVVNSADLSGVRSLLGREQADWPGH